MTESDIRGPASAPDLPRPQLQLVEPEGDRDAMRDELLRMGERLVHHIAAQIRRTARVPSDYDLVTPGTVGLVHAVDTFDPDRGLAFSTFAAPRIRGAILEHLRRQEVLHG